MGDSSKKSPDHYYPQIPDIQLEMSKEEIENRKIWLGLGADDEANISHLDQLVARNVDGLLDFLYDHFLAHDDTASFFPTEEVLKRAKEGQRHYFLQLTCGKYDRDYVDNRLIVGKTHYRIGLDTRWYLGAYYRALKYLRALIVQEFKSDPAQAEQLVDSLTKLIFFDMGLAIDTYNAAKIQAIREHKDMITRLETERAVSKSIVENAPIGIVRLSSDFKCLEANSEFLAFLGDADERIVGRSIFDLCVGLPRADFEEAFSLGVSKRASAAKLRFFNSDHETFFDWAIWPIKETNDKVSALVATFTLVNDSVRLQQQREDFVATLTHDLKTPILAANRALKLLMEGDFGPIQDSQKSIIETILQSNNAMYQMVLTLLDVYKYDSGAKQLAIIPTDLPSAIQTLVSELEPLATQKRIDILFAASEHNIPVMCDIDEIRRVLQNLIDNSLKYTQSNGKITVSLSQDEQLTTISVTDTGKGISEADKPKLFQRFWQASSGGRYYASTGLGLYLCSKIVESHGGKLWCDSEVGKGSTFSFTLNNVEMTQ